MSNSANLTPDLRGALNARNQAEEDTIGKLIAKL